jgi:hypothetical protein
MATVNVTPSYVWASGETVTPTKLNSTASPTVTATLADGEVTNAKINASAGIAHSKLANIAAGQVLLGNASNVPTATTLSGDVTVTSSGVTAIGASKVTAGMVASGAITQAKLASNVAGVGPLFIASSSSAQAIPTADWTQVLLQTESVDTNSNFDSNVFTATIAGYYHFEAASQVAGTASNFVIAVYRNGILALQSPHIDASIIRNTVSGIIYLGVSDYVDLRAYHGAGSNRSISSTMSGFLARAA